MTDEPTHVAPAAPAAPSEHERLVALVGATADRDPEALGALWLEVVARVGQESASRIWQEGLASSDVGQT